MGKGSLERKKKLVMTMKKIIGGAAALVAGVEIAGTFYLYRSTMRRSAINKKNMVKWNPVNWEVYKPMLQKAKERLLSCSHEDVYLSAGDGVRLHGMYFPGEKEDKAVICFHGYAGDGVADYTGMSEYFLDKGYSLLLVDLRAHGKSGGEDIGFGIADREDVLLWVDWMRQRAGDNVRILLHGISMGGTAVLMASGMHLPDQVCGIVSDSAYTSPRDAFSYVLKKKCHVPALPVVGLMDVIHKKRLGYGLDEYNAAREVRRAKVPALLIHGSEDQLVPEEICQELYESYAGKVQKVVIEGAGHAEGYYKDPAAYKKAMDEFVEEVFA